MKSNRYTVAIDLGESNVVVCVGSKDKDGLIAIDAIVSRPCEGVKSGMIDNIALVEESLKSVITEVEKSLNIRILEAYAGISGEFVRFACHSDHVYVAQPLNGVSESDAAALFDRMKHVQAPDNETIMERIPQNYVVDNDKEVKNPVGSFGRRLSSTFNFILCGNTAMQRLENAFNRLGIKLMNIYPNTLAVADSVLTPDEKEEGVAVVDIGGGLTDVAIYYRNVVRYIISIPMGATSINSDIRSMMIPDKYIEKLKCDYGSAVADMVPENKAIRVNGRTPREAKNILLYNLAVAIEARVSMLIDFIKREINDSGYEDKLPYGIVLTGGSARLKNIEELFRRMTDMEVRIGAPMNEISKESLDEIDMPEYSTAVGILIRGMRHGVCTTECIEEPTPDLDSVIEVTPKVETPKVETPKVETPEPIKMPPPKIKPSEIYTPPPPRPYTPPAPHHNEVVVHKVEEEVQRESTPTPLPSESTINQSFIGTQIDDAPIVAVDIEEDEEATPSPKDDVLPKPKGRNWGDIFRNALEKFNGSFESNADEDEI